jgi:hypothetical protein
MPVLAVADEGNGRSVALGIDGAWMLTFSSLGAQTAGRGYGALWDGLLGWLMRDPRFEPAQIDLPEGCVAQLPSKLTVRPGPNVTMADDGAVTLDIVRLDEPSGLIHMQALAPAGPAYSVDFALPVLPAGGYSARVRRGGGPTTKRDFACEAGGDEWADSRPDPERLRRPGSGRRWQRSP